MKALVRAAPARAARAGRASIARWRGEGGRAGREREGERDGPRLRRRESSGVGEPIRWRAETPDRGTRGRRSTRLCSLSLPLSLLTRPSSAQPAEAPRPQPWPPPLHPPPSPSQRQPPSPSPTPPGPTRSSSTSCATSTRRSSAPSSASSRARPGPSVPPPLFSLSRASWGGRARVGELRRGIRTRWGEGRPQKADLVAPPPPRPSAQHLCFIPACVPPALHLDASRPPVRSLPPPTRASPPPARSQPADAPSPPPPRRVAPCCAPLPPPSSRASPSRS